MGTPGAAPAQRAAGPPSLRRAACRPAQRKPRGRRGALVRADGEQQFLESLQTRRSRDIGSPHGEGFVQYTSRGALHLDVELLNDKMKAHGAQRMRQALKPDEAHGAVLSFDGVVANTRALQRAAWQRVAQERGLPLPGVERGQLFHTRPERAITEVLQWTRDWKEAQAIAYEVAQEYGRQLGALREPVPGAREWLHALSKVHVPCAVVTALDRLTLRAALERMGLAEFFTAMVTAEDDMDSIALGFLSAAVKLGRPPNRCVVFDASPDGITAAHNCSMKAVAVQTTHPAWQLKHADLAVGRLTELSVINVRRLFANVGAEFMDLQQQQAPGRPRLRRTRNGVAD